MAHMDPAAPFILRVHHTLIGKGARKNFLESIPNGGMNIFFIVIVHFSKEKDTTNMNAQKTEKHLAKRYIEEKRITAFGKKIYRYTRQSAP
jgi:hypothetical protein